MRQFQPTDPDRPLAIRATAIGQLFEEWSPPKDLFETVGPAAVVDISGILVAQPDGKSLDFKTIVRATRAAAMSGAKAIVLRVNSPGGDAIGMGECGRELRAISKESGKPLIAWVSREACSAAYALISAAATIILDEFAQVGSIGVYQPRLDATAADAATGMHWEIISSGVAKLDGNPHTVITEAERRRTKAKVDDLADLFFALVAEMRPTLSAGKMRDLDGATVIGQQAVKSGLADLVGSWSDVLATVASGDSAKASATAKESVMADEEKVDKKSAARKAIMGAVEAMQKALDAAFGDDDDKDKAEGEPSEEDKKKDEEAKAKAKAEDEKKDAEAKAKAKADEDEKEKAKALAAKGSLEAAIALGVANAESVQSLKAELAKRDENDAREKLLALRPDFDATMRATLALAPIETVRDAVNKWPRIGGKGEPAVKPPAALSARGVQGAGGVAEGALAPDVAEAMDRAMGLKSEVHSGKGLERVQGGFSTEFQPMTPEQAAKRLAELTSGKAA
jgi:ClpP class serine protease